MTTLFDLPLPAAKADPATSKIAARQLVASGTRARQCAEVLALVAAHPGLTSFELSKATGTCRFVIARRLPELAKLGLVTRGPARHCSVTGRLAVTWAEPVT